jgi:hypothetical protein
MANQSRSLLRTVAIAGSIVAAVLATVVIASVVVFMSRYVRKQDMGPDSAAREFEQVRSRFASQLPLIEFRGFQDPTVRRSSSAPRRELVALHVLAYSPDDGKLTRADFPADVLRFMSVGGRLRLMYLDTFGDDRDRVTLEDLERHGPGLILDVGGGAVGQLLVGDAILGTNARSSRLLVWTE